MKAVTALLFLSMSVFASDGYHKYEEAEVCPTDKACVYTGAQSITLAQQGSGYLRVTTQSPLTDVIRLKQLCYKGELDEVSMIFKGLAENESFSYYGGGHTAVEHMGFVKEKDGTIRVVAKIRDDYGDRHVNEKVSECR